MPPQPPPSPSPKVLTPIADDASALDSGHVWVRTPMEPLNGAARKYSLAVDPLQEDRATEIRLLSFARPHMRAFHYSWLSFFVAFVGWFSIPPLMPTIKKQLGLSSDQVANTNIASVASTIAGRIVVGPLCDRYGPRVVQAALLLAGAVPVACAGFANSYAGLVVVRFFIGLVGCSFVATTYWTSIVFSKQIVGSANAIAAGWGNLGAGATYLITPFLFDLVTYKSFGVTDDLGWRITLLFPALFMVLVGVLLYKYSDDCPRGNYADLRHRKSLQRDSRHSIQGFETDTSNRVSLHQALRVVAKMPVTWILAFQYACSFGVELQVHNVLSLFYYEDFTHKDCVVATDPRKCRILTQTTAGLISSLFGLMCIFARAMGGVASDVASRNYAMKGRIIVQFVAFAGQAIALYLYAHTKTIAWSIPALIVFGIFVQACTGTTFAIVPYVSPRYTGATSGIVGAGGNVGALCWGFLFKGVGNRAQSFKYLSAFVAVSALLCGVTKVEGEGSMWRLVNGGSTTTHGYGTNQRLVTNDFEANTDERFDDEDSSPGRAKIVARHQRENQRML